VNEGQYFTEHEAHDKLGRFILARESLSGMPIGVEGRVIDTRMGNGGWLVCIAWGVSGRPWPLNNWLNRYQYNFYLTEVQTLSKPTEVAVVTG